MDPRLTYGSLLVPSVPAGAAAAAAVAAGLHPQHLHSYHNQLTPSVHHLAHSLHPFGQASTVSHHLNHHESSSNSSSNSVSNSNNRSNHSNSNINPVTGKVKRARQRVDAGEPRNSYASITNFSSTRSSAFHHPGKSTGSGLHHNRSSGIFKSTSSSSSLSSSTSTPSSSSSCLSKSSSSGLSYALSSPPSTCSSCSFCSSNNQSHHHHHHHHNRSSSSHHHHSHLLQSSTNSGGSGIGIQCNDKMTSQYKENQINFTKQQNVDNIVASLTSSNSNVILGVRGVGGSGSASGNNNTVNMYHNGQSSQQQSQQQQQQPYINNYSDEQAGKQQSLTSFNSKTSVPPSPLTSPIPLTNYVDHLINATSSSSSVSSSTPTKPTVSSSYSSSIQSSDNDNSLQQSHKEETGNGGSSSSAHLLRVILQKGRRGGREEEEEEAEEAGGSSNSIKSNNQVNCDKNGSNCETTRKGENDTDEEKDDEDDEETDSGRTITDSPLNNGEEGGDKVDDEGDEDDNSNNNKSEHNEDDTNEDDDEVTGGGGGGEVGDDDDITDDENDYVEASCSVESEGEPDGGDYRSGRGCKGDRYNLDTDEYNNNEIMSLNDESKNEFHDKRVPESTDKRVNHDKSDSCSPSSNEVTCNNNKIDPESSLQLISDNIDEQSSSATVTTSSISASTTTTTTISANCSTISDVKRARVENIVTNMLPRSNSISGQSIKLSSEDSQQVESTIKDQSSSTSSQQSSTIVNGCKKRKLYQPQQSKSNGSLEDDDDDLLDDIVQDDDERDDDDLMGREEEDEMNDSLIGLSSSNINSDYEMSEINDLSIKSSVKCEIGDKNDLQDESLIKNSSPAINRDGLSTLVAKCETKTEPSASSNQSNSITNTPKDLSNYKGTLLSPNRSVKVSRKDHRHRHNTEDDLPDDVEGMADDEFVDDQDSSRVSHSLTHRRFGGLQDPAQLLNEARKLVYEQEKMTKGSSSHDHHHHHHHHSHHRQSSRSSRKRSLVATSTTVNGLGVDSLPPTATSPPIYYSDIEWLRETLKAEMQAHLIPSFSTIIDSVINRFCQRRAASAAAAVAAASRSNQQFLPHKEPGDSIIQRASESSTSEASKELTLLSQMLESKSPRTSLGKAAESSSSQQSQFQSNIHSKTAVPRDSFQHNHLQSHSSSSSSHRQSNTPVNQLTTGSNGSNNKSPLNGHHQHLHSHIAHHHRGSSNSPSSFTLPTESAPVPKPSGPSPFAFPSGFKSNLLFHNFPSGLPGTAAASSTQPNLLHASIAQHLNSFASVFHQQHQQSSQQRSSDAHNERSVTTTPPSTAGREQSTPSSANFSVGQENQNSSAREGSPVDSEHVRVSSNAGHISPSEMTSGGEQTEAISLVVTPKRKRLKVTDSRITPRTVNRILNQEPLLANLIARGELPSSSPPPSLNFGLSPYNGPHIGPPTAPPPPLVPVSLPTSVAIPNPGLHSAELFGGPVFPFSDHARLLRESIFCQAAAAAAAASNGPVSLETESKDHEKDNLSHHEPSINDSQISQQHQQQSQSKQSPQQLTHYKQKQEDDEQSQQLRDEDIRQRHHHHNLHHHQAAQQQQAAAVAAAAAAAAQQHHHHQAATAAAIHNALAANHLAMLAQANRAAGGGDTASPESLSQFGGTRSDNGADGSESLNDSTGYDTSTPLMSFCGNSLALQTTLTPMHLRKAKLMFFYVRYPSSNVLKTFFPDIKFNKNNTAQLVKWFSNFREFYYIQMEKYARQAITEGIKSADDIHIHRESELLRVLNMHYNRSNHLDVPERFCFVVEQTLKEFFKSILAGKDNEQSWKKAIYKIISRLDDSVPEYFKSPNFLERLE